MMEEIIANKYSQAIFDIACEQNALDEIGNELKSIQNMLHGTPELRMFVSHPLIPAEAKKETLEKLFAGSVQPIVLQFVYVMVDRHRESLLDEAITGFIRLSREKQHIEVAKVRVVQPLSPSEETNLVRNLEKLTGEKIEPVYIIDPSIIGGMVIQIGDRLIDGSLARQLKNMEATLLRSEVGGIEVTKGI